MEETLSPSVVVSPRSKPTIDWNQRIEESNNTDEQSKETVTDSARKAVVLIKKMSEHVDKGDVQSFIPAAKTTFLALASLRELITSRYAEQAPNLAQKLQNLSVYLIKNAKDHCQSQSESSKQDFLFTKQAIAQHLQDILVFERGFLQSPTSPRDIANSNSQPRTGTPMPTRVQSQNSLHSPPSPTREDSEMTGKKFSQTMDKNAIARAIPATLRKKPQPLVPVSTKNIFEKPEEKNDEKNEEKSDEKSEEKSSEESETSQNQSEASTTSSDKTDSSCEWTTTISPEGENKRIKWERSKPNKNPITVRKEKRVILATTASHPILSSSDSNVQIKEKRNELIKSSSEKSTQLDKKINADRRSSPDLPPVASDKTRRPQLKRGSTHPNKVGIVQNTCGFNTLRKATNKLEDKLIKLDPVIELLEIYFPSIKEHWKNMDESKRSELRKQMNERLVKIELNERVELECSKLSSSRGFDYIRQFCDSCIEFVSSFHSCLCDMDRSSQLPPSDRETHFKATFFKYLDYLFEILKYELNKLSKDKSSASIQSLPEVIDFILKSTSDFKNYDFDSNDTYFIQAVRPHNINSFEHQLRQALWHTSNDVNTLMTRIIASLTAIFAADTLQTHIVWEFVATTYSLNTFLTRLLKFLQTARGVSRQRASNYKLSERAANPEDIEELIDVDIWKESALQTESKGSVTQGTLNTLIQTLTSEYQIDSNFMKTFIYTYRSFTTPRQLFSKLCRRFMVPPEFSDKQHTAIQLRVCVVLKYWIQNQFLDFDDELVEEVLEFLETTVRQSGHTQMVAFITVLLKDKVRERAALSTKLNLLPEHIQVIDNTCAPIDLIMGFPVEEVAKQITLIDLSILQKIQPSELMKQAWNSAKLRYRSMYVNFTMERLNLISYWVPTVILSFPTVQNRRKAISWFYNLAVELRKLNNFQSLMAVICGFNVAGLQRMRFSFEFADKELQKKFSALEELMSPSSSFKSYRAALSKTPLPAIPYLGVYLSDLVFIEEGNADEVNGLINFQKHELIYKTVESLQIYQTSSYQFPILEPIHQLVSAVPNFTEEILYRLSLSLEPRNALKEDIQ